MTWQAEQKIMVYGKNAFIIDIVLAPLGVLAFGAPIVGLVAVMLRSRSIVDICVPLAVALAAGFMLVWCVRRPFFLHGLRSRTAVSLAASELQSWDHKGCLRHVKWSSITEVRITRWALTVCWSGTDEPQRLVLKYPEAWCPDVAAWLPDEIARRAELDERIERWRLQAPGREIVYRHAEHARECRQPGSGNR